MYLDSWWGWAPSLCRPGPGLPDPGPSLPLPGGSVQSHPDSMLGWGGSQGCREGCRCIPLGALSPPLVLTSTPGSTWAPPSAHLRLCPSDRASEPPRSLRSWGRRVGGMGSLTARPRVPQESQYGWSCMLGDPLFRACWTRPLHPHSGGSSSTPERKAAVPAQMLEGGLPCP